MRNLHAHPSQDSEPAGRPRLDAGAWLVLALTLLVMVVNGVVTIGPMLLPGDGWAFSDLAWRDDQPQWVALRPLRAGAAPLLPGDQLLSIDGQPMPALLNDAFALRLRRPAQWVDGGQVEYVVVRDGQTVSLSVTLGQVGPAELLAILTPPPAEALAGLVLPLTFIIALVVFWQRPELPAARLLLLFGAAVATGFVQPPVMTGTVMHSTVLLLPYLVSLWQIVLIPALLHLLLVLPVVKWPLRARPLPALVVLYGGAQVLIWAAWLLNWGQASRVIGLYYGIVAVHALAAFAAMFASLAHSWLTVRSSVQRAQLAWMTFGLGVGFIGSALLWVVSTLFFAFDSNWAWAAQLVLLALPLGLAVAILRYRLFDINVLVNRALVYGTLTVLLALAYFGAVVVLQGLLRALTGAAQSQLVTVLSTLAIAALFSPLRARLQILIDRRFYRHKYDAARTLAAFGASLRDEVDLNVLAQRLVGVVEDTMEPAQAWLWFRPQKGPAPSTGTKRQPRRAR